MYMVLAFLSIVANPNAAKFHPTVMLNTLHAKFQSAQIRLNTLLQRLNNV